MSTTPPATSIPTPCPEQTASPARDTGSVAATQDGSPHTPRWPPAPDMAGGGSGARGGEVGRGPPVAARMGWRRLTVRQRLLQQQQAEQHPKPHGESGRGAGLRQGGRGGGFEAGRSSPVRGAGASAAGCPLRARPSWLSGTEG